MIRACDTTIDLSPARNCSLLLRSGHLLLADADPWRCTRHLVAAESYGAHSTEAHACVGNAVDALLGRPSDEATLIVWSGEGAEADLERIADLRAARHCCRLILIADVYPGAFRDPQRLLGACQVEHYVDLEWLLRSGELDALEIPGTRLVDILDSGIVPETLNKGYAWAIYGPSPGRSFREAADAVGACPATETDKSHPLE